MMRVLKACAWLLTAVGVAASSHQSPTEGVESLVKRRLPQHVDSFEFVLEPSHGSGLLNDTYTVSSTNNGKVRIEGTTTSALLSGLHKYLSGEANVDIWWFTGSQLHQAPKTLPKLKVPIKGSSVVPYRYYWNTVTTSYTSAFWSWEDWETQLDWMALRGVNLALAWIGVEKVFIDVFHEIGLNDEEIDSFISGPAFLAWNHFGNIQGSWGGSLPRSWVDEQFSLQLKIITRMQELGITPILPAFPGFVPRNISRVFPDISLSMSPVWSDFGTTLSADTYINPFDPRFAQLQKLFINKQQELYGNVTNFWTLDQFNENRPLSGDLDYLRNVSHNTWTALKAADPEAVWVMQAWLFSSDSSFWTNDRIEAFLGGIPDNSDMLLLDLFAESAPQWQRTDSFYGKPWIWCELHDYGGNMGLYGQIENVTINSVDAVRSSDSIVGFGLTMEGQEGNEIMYDLLLDQAWSPKPIDTETYFHDWVSARYSTEKIQSLYKGWEMLRPTVFNNTNMTVNAVQKSILELTPSISGLLGRTGHHGTTIMYDQAVMVDAWSELFKAGLQDLTLFKNPNYQYDLVDWTRQVLVNSFEDLYKDLVDAYNKSSSATVIRSRGAKLVSLLKTLDAVLATDENFQLAPWIEQARASDPSAADFFEFNARNQITLWGPQGQIEDYASKQWAGLVGTYYAERWQQFVDYLAATKPASYNQTAFHEKLLIWETAWGQQTSTRIVNVGVTDIRSVLDMALKSWGELFKL
ncbi:glycoside hydrolase family 89 protein [Trichoderma longibrachiatum]|uniref:Glycoside hydrolase family 89 protein n=1 Tax=Trichoderma longibrachiatum ATCC 18648 TaxID=983965 RepID=A0A2T4CHT0_TRILO|nr:glycoside hydrolase family 89 protein [Trichoderma longibrachiatum ATCC 18648]